MNRRLSNAGFASVALAGTVLWPTPHLGVTAWVMGVGIGGGVAIVAVVATVVLARTRRAARRRHAKLDAELAQCRRTEANLRELEQRYRVMSEAVEFGGWVAGPDGGIRYASQAFLDLLGMTLEEVQHAGWVQRLIPEDIEGTQKQWLRCMDTGEDWSFEFRIRHHDGRLCTILSRGRAIRDDTSQQIIGWVGINLDITQRKLIEEQFRDGEQRFRAVVEQAGEAIYLVDPATGAISDPNPKFGQLLGYGPGDLGSLTVYDLMFDPREAVDTRMRAAMEEGPQNFGERRYRRKDGAAILVEVSATAIRYGDRRVVCYRATDVTQRRRSQQQLDRLFSLSRDMLAVTTFEGYFLRVNSAWERALGWSAKELMHRPMIEFVHPDDRRVTMEQMEKLAHGEPLNYFENRYRCKDGGYRWLAWAATPEVEEGLVYAVARDQTDRKRAEQALRDSEQRTRAIIDHAYDAFIGMDGSGRVVEWNPQAEAMFGWSRAEAIGRLVVQTIIPERYREAHNKGLSHFLQTGEGPLINRRVEVAGLRRDGREVPVELSITAIPLGSGWIFAAFIRDITERRQREALLDQRQHELEQAVDSERKAREELERAQWQMIQTEKLAALGQMVAGVAHEINNPLSFVSNNEAVLQRDLASLREYLRAYHEADDVIAAERPELMRKLRTLQSGGDLDYAQRNVQQLLQRSREGLGRIQQIIRDLRDFARLDENELQETDLNAGVRSTVNIVIGRAKRRDITIDCDLNPLPRIVCYPAKINQVILNLLSNAIDACDRGGTIRVTTQHVGETVQMRVADNGRGVPEENRRRIFDPFFTTKPPGKGTGLGLSISYGIVQDHGGKIELESNPGGGSVFIVTLPLHPPPRLLTADR